MDRCFLRPPKIPSELPLLLRRTGVMDVHDRGNHRERRTQMKQSKSPDQATTEAVAPAQQPEAPNPTTAAPQGAPVAPAKASPKKEASQKKDAPKAQKGAQKASPKAKAAKPAKQAKA